MLMLGEDRIRPSCKVSVLAWRGRGGGNVGSPRSADLSRQPIAQGRLVGGAGAAQALQPLQAELRDAAVLTGAAHGSASSAWKSGAFLLEAVRS